MKYTVLILVVFLTSSCATAQSSNTPIDAGPFPEDYEIQINDYLHATLKDPYSIRELTIQRPVKERRFAGLLYGGYKTAWFACASYNAKNSYGAYTGTKTDMFVFESNTNVYIRNYFECN